MIKLQWPSVENTNMPGDETPAEDADMPDLSGKVFSQMLTGTMGLSGTRCTNAD